MKFPVRIKCATLSWNALAQGLRELETAAAKPTGRKRSRARTRFQAEDRIGPAFGAVDQLGLQGTGSNDGGGGDVVVVVAGAVVPSIPLWWTTPRMSWWRWMSPPPVPDGDS